MLSDRSYMRAPSTERGTSAHVWLISSVIAGYVLQLFFQFLQARPGPDLFQRVALSGFSLREFRLWTLLTHGWVHDTHNILQIIMVVAGLILLGGELIKSIGPRAFLILYGASIVTGGLFWSVIHWQTGGVLAGATAGICGLLAYFAWLKPEIELRFLLFFFIPVAIRPKIFVMALAGVSLGASIFYEIYGAVAPFAYAPSSHFGGLFAGWLYFNLSQGGLGYFFRSRGSNPSSLSNHSQGVKTAEPTLLTTPTSSKQREHLRAEVDRILDKINSTGLNSLTRDEKEKLNQAKNLRS
jgi:membrane associated rhomboid family serine protease